ncbi:phosphodiester glycosidase family protein [Patescibacteria group bacterium]|nr:phosphodiester glycosidase family protein [Patescibacteria group bacterium]
MKFLDQKDLPRFRFGEAGIAPIVVILGIFIASLVFLFVKGPKTPYLKSNITPVLIKPSPTPALTPTPTPTPIPTPTPTSTPLPKPTSTPTPTQQPVVTNNTPPGSGYSRQNVSVDGQTFPVSIIAADLNSTKVIVDTASDSDCSNDCPVLSLGDYVGRNGAYAGINGSFFCPKEYPSCAGKTNSFDTLVMNKNKHYFNSDNNVYSTVPAAIFSAGSARFVSRSLEWGRDTGVDSVIANYPLLVSGGNISYSEAPNEPKFGQKGPRSFIAAKGNIVYIGIVHNATMGESAKVLKALEMGDALNLDEGGSTALWFGGYKAGPGRNIPNAVLFVQR